MSDRVRGGSEFELHFKCWGFGVRVSICIGQAEQTYRTANSPELLVHGTPPWSRGFDSDFAARAHTCTHICTHAHTTIHTPLHGIRSGPTAPHPDVCHPEFLDPSRARRRVQVQRKPNHALQQQHHRQGAAHCANVRACVGRWVRACVRDAYVMRT